MEWRDPSKACNIVRDWNMAQGFSHATDEHIQIRRDINIRHVSVENSSQRPIGIAITTFYGGPIDSVPKLQFILGPGEVKDIGINSIGSPMQFINPLDPVNGKRVGKPYPFQTDSQQFVLRDGTENWFVQAFKRGVYTAA